MNKKVLLEEMTWQEVQERLKETDIALIPTGSTEEHGPHLPVNNDTFTAFMLAKRAAEMAYDRVKTVVVPAVLVQYWELGYDLIIETLETEGKVFGHAGEMETSISWALGQRVLEDKRGKGIPPKTPSLEDYTQPIFRPKIPIHIGVLDPKVQEWLTPEKSCGVIGDATLASKRKEKKYFSTC